MLNKVISASSFILLTAILFEALFNPLDPVFLFFSDNPFVAVIRTLLVGGMVYFSFKKSVSGRTKKSLAVLGSMLIITGFVCLMLTPIQGTLIYNYFHYLDFLVMIEAGVIFSSVALSRAPITKISVKTA